MKKITSIIAISFALSASFATAAGTAITGGKVTKTACTLLETDANISLSKNVAAAVNCDTVAAAITLGTCSTAGSRASQDFTCSYKDPADPTQGWNVDGCAVVGAKITVTDYKGFTLSSKGGTMGATSFKVPCDIAGAAIAGAL